MPCKKASESERGNGRPSAERCRRQLGRVWEVRSTEEMLRLRVTSATMAGTSSVGVSESQGAHHRRGRPSPPHLRSGLLATWALLCGLDARASWPTTKGMEIRCAMVCRPFSTSCSVYSLAARTVPGASNTYMHDSASGRMFSTPGRYLTSKSNSPIFSIQRA